MRVAPRAASAWRSDGCALFPGARGRRVGVSHAIQPPALSQGDFQRGLAVRPRARSEHFLLHHLGPSAMPVDAELSTSAASSDAGPVDGTQRFGQIVPKRHARRAVTRNLIRRQGRSAFEHHAPRLAAGDWFLRLRAPFPVQQFPSAASHALKAAVRRELESLFATVAAA